MDIKDVVGTFIEYKEQEKDIKEKLRALEVLIFENNRDDERITIVKGRRTLNITDLAYNTLKMIGVETTIIEERNKVLDEFDVETRKIILDTPEYHEEKFSKESIRIKKGKE